MRPVTTKKPLRLGRETLRVLSSAQLANVAGGATQDCNLDPEMTTRVGGNSGQYGGNAGCMGGRHPVERL